MNAFDGSELTYCKSFLISYYSYGQQKLCSDSFMLFCLGSGQVDGRNARTNVMTTSDLTVDSINYCSRCSNAILCMIPPLST